MLSRRIVQKQPLFARSFSSMVDASSEKQSLSQGIMADVHGTIHGKKAWRNKPLFRRGGDKRFRDGKEASEMLYEEVVRRDPYQVEFLQASKILLESVSPVFDRYPKYAWTMKQLLEPERVIQFRVPWVDDEQNRRVNRGFRVQFSSSLGPYVGGLRFHRNTGHGTVKFLGLENVFRNALAGDFGGAAGGSDFDPTDKSEAEIMRFCQSFMTELANYIGPNTDIPGAGVGVGHAEIGYMFGQYKRIHKSQTYTTDGIISGGQHWYPESIGHGIAHFAEVVLQDRGTSVAGKRCVISGSGVAALHTADKLLDMGANVIAISDSSGYIIESDGFNKDRLQNLSKIKSERNARIGAYIMSSTTADYVPTSEGKIWDVPCDFAFPCAMQNDIDGTIAQQLIDNGCQGIFEGANMPLTEEALHVVQDSGIAYAPSKAANSAPLFVSRNQNRNLSSTELDDLVRDSMQLIYRDITNAASTFHSKGALNAGANITSFLRVATAMIQQGAV